MKLVDMHDGASAPRGRITVLHGKFVTYLQWSQPFLHDLISGLEDHVANVVLCGRAENLGRFPTPRLARVLDRHLASPYHCALAAAAIQRKFHPDVLHAHFGWSAVRLLPLARLLGAPLVVTVGGRDVRAQMADPLYSELYAEVFRQAALVVCVCRDLAEELARRGVEPRKLRVIHRGVAAGAFPFVDRSGRGAPLNLVTVGRLVEKKGHGVALRGLAGSLARGVDARLVIVGDGREMARLRLLARDLGVADRVEFAGRLERDGVRRRLERADILLHCAVTAADGDAEGLPNAVLEAGASGLPAIASRHGGIAEAVRDGDTGILVAEDDPEAVAGAIERMARDEAARLAAGRAASRLVRAEFTLEREVDAHAEAYRMLASATARAGRTPDRPWPLRSLFAALERALRPSPLDRDLTVDVALAWLTGRHGNRTLLGPEPTPLDRVVSLSALMPGALRSRLARMIVPRLGAWAASARVQAPRGPNQAADLLERHLSTGTIEQLDPGWTPAELERFLASGGGAGDGSSTRAEAER